MLKPILAFLELLKCLQGHCESFVAEFVNLVSKIYEFTSEPVFPTNHTIIQLSWNSQISD
jgi:hypothetical protein